MAAFPSREVAASEPSFLSRASIDESIRLIKNEATECTCVGLVAASTPEMYASITAP